MSSSLIQKLNAKLYAVKGWKNPFFQAPSPEKTHTGIPWFVGGGFFVFIALVSLIFWIAVRPTHLLTDIKIEGTRMLPSQRFALSIHTFLQEEKWLGIPRLFSWRINTTALEQMLITTYPLEHASCVLDKHMLTCAVEEKVQFIPLKVSNQIFLLDKNGVVIRETTQDELTAGKIIPSEKLFFLVAEEGTNAPSVGTPFLKASYLQSLEQYGILLHQYANLTLSQFALTTDAARVIVQTDKPYTIIINPFLNAATQVARYQKVMHELPIDQQPTTYIDIRFHERIYVR